MSNGESFTFGDEPTSAGPAEWITIEPTTVMITTMQLVMEQLQSEHTAPVSTSSIALSSACRHEIVQFTRL